MRVMRLSHGEARGEDRGDGGQMEITLAEERDDVRGEGIVLGYCFDIPARPAWLPDSHSYT